MTNATETKVDAEVSITTCHQRSARSLLSFSLWTERSQSIRPSPAEHGKQQLDLDTQQILVRWHHHVLRDLRANDQKLKTMSPSTMKAKVVALPEGKHPVRTGEILDKTTVDPEQETAGVQRSSDSDSSARTRRAVHPTCPCGDPNASASGGVNSTGIAVSNSRPDMHQNFEVTTPSIIGISHNYLSRWRGRCA